METPIYYHYNKTTGEYGGSGITNIEDETWGSTLIAPPEPPLAPVLSWDGNAWSWSA